MADNTVLNTMSGGDTIQTEDVGGSKIQRIKIALVAKDVDALQDVTNLTPLPVIITNTTVSGTPTTISGQQHTLIDNIPTYQGVRLYDINGNLFGLSLNPLYSTTVSGSKTDVQNFPTVQTVNVMNMPTQTSVSGTNLHMFQDNVPTFQGVRLFDANGNIIGIPTSPATVSGIITANVLVPKRAGITASSSGDNTIISAPTNGQRIYVTAFELSFSGTVNAKFTDGAGGTLLGGLYYGIANAGAANSLAPDSMSNPPAPVLWIGSPNTALVLNLSGAVAVGGGVSYFVI